jgi:hypothetical protein
VTIEDGSGAILVRYPAGASTPGVGSVIRAAGAVGTWYGGRQVEAEEAPRRLRETRAVPTILRRPPGDADEWQLVAVTVRLLEVTSDGDTWRAEATLGAAGELPIVGLASSGTDADGLEAGRSARIVGIVKRAHPSASDQRFAIAPRSADDIVLGRLVASQPDEGAVTDGESGALGTLGGSAGLADLAASIPSVTLDSLADRAEGVVRVGGRLERLEGTRLTLDDGTAVGHVRLADAVEPIEPPLQVGEVLNVVGRVRERAPGQPEVVVRSAADVSRAASLRSAEPSPGPDEPTALLAALIPGGPSLTPPAHTAAMAQDGSWSPLLLLALMAAALALLLLGSAVLALRWPRLAERWHALAGRLPGHSAPGCPNAP